MKNPLTFRIESLLGSAFVLLFTGFMISLIFVAQANFNSELEIMDATSSSIKVISPREKLLIEQWLQGGEVSVPAGKNKYRFILEKYPERPWYIK